MAGKTGDPKNRQFVDEILKTLGLSVNNTKGIIDVCMDCPSTTAYWVVPAGFDGRFADYNLYENRFSEALSLVAYTGVGGRRGGVLHLAGADYQQRYVVEGLEVCGG